MRFKMTKSSRKYQDMQSNELKSKLKDLKIELLRLNNQRNASINSKVASDIKRTKKDIARILTILRKKEEQVKEKTINKKSTEQNTKQNTKHNIKQNNKNRKKNTNKEQKDIKIEDQNKKPKGKKTKTKGNE